MTEPVAPKSRGIPTAADIEAAWKDCEKPSQRAVEEIMRLDGWDISASSIIRCVNRGFKPRARASTKPVKTSPEIDAVRQVTSTAPADAPAEIVAAALVEAIKNLPDGAKDRVKELIGMDDHTIEAQANKLVRVARYLLAEDLAQHTKLMMLAPDKAAKLYAALGTTAMPVTTPPSPEGVKVIDHNANEPRRLSASAQAIADFRQKRGVAA